MMQSWNVRMVTSEIIQYADLLLKKYFWLLLNVKNSWKQQFFSIFNSMHLKWTETDRFFVTL